MLKQLAFLTALSAMPALSAAAQDPCAAPYCSAVPGDRAQGWSSQHRSEVMARNGIVATSQPLAAEAGLEILRKGGNAIDAAVATAAVLSVVEPMNVGPAGDLFAIVYIAKENKVYALNASGMAPRGLTPAHLASLGYTRDSANWGPGSGMPDQGILPVTVPGYFFGATRQMRSVTSSVTSSAPSGATQVHTGRPYTSFSLAMNPVRKSSGRPGLPSANGTNATLYPLNCERFHDPRWPTNAPPRYFAGNASAA